MDVLVSAIVLISFVQTEGKRLGMRLLWLPTVAVFLVGVSLGLPLFLYLRQIQLDRTVAVIADDFRKLALNCPEAVESPRAGAGPIRGFCERRRENFRDTRISRQRLVGRETDARRTESFCPERFENFSSR